MTYRELERRAVTVLSDADVPDPENDARLLMLHTIREAPYRYLLIENEEINSSDRKTYEDLIRKRAERIPLQHLTGYQEFMGIGFLVTPDVLVPRQDTETLCEAAEQVLSSGDRILDVCTGSGCILLSLLKRNREKLPGLSGLGTDLSEKALKVAEKNGRRLGLTDIASFQRSDLFDGVDGKFSLIVSNPPYIPSDEIDGLMTEVRDHDPRLALDGGEDGLSIYRRLIPAAYEHLEEGGNLFLEIGYDQSHAVSDLLQKAGFTEIRTLRDLSGNDRVVTGKKNGTPRG